MAECRGNRGNLMQHWLLCHTLDRLAAGGAGHLLLACTHAMAPASNASTEDRHFKAARGRLSDDRGLSLYERTWASLTGGTGLPYPNSAAFAWKLWPRKLSMLLCEAEPETAQELCSWLSLPKIGSRLESKTLYPGDWRKGLISVTERLIGVDVLYIEQDPMQYDDRDVVPRAKQRNKLFPCDIRQVLDLAEPLSLPVILQVSSFTANGGFTHERTRTSLEGILGPAGFRLQGEVTANKHMISLVYAARLPADLWSSSQTPQTLFDERFPKD